MKKLLALLVLTSAACSPNLPSYTVMVTSLAMDHGGSGSIIEHSPTGSTVLTNKHVCEVVKSGGIVQSEAGNAYVVSYKMSEAHDLCLIRVQVDLKHSTRVASSLPVPYEEVTVSGHPHLLPTIMTPGHVSSKRVIQVMLGARDCTEAEMNDPATAMFCALIGKIPLVKSFEAISLSNLIQPGSSGSGVYNAGGRISAVIFAGDGDMAFGYAVPLEYVYNFVNFESKRIAPTKVDSSLSFSQMVPDRKAFIEKVTKVCSESSPEVKASISKICGLFLSATKHSDMVQR